jgi:hypothetical protein
MTEKLHPHPLLLDISPEIEEELTPEQAYQMYSAPQNISLPDLQMIHKAGKIDTGKNEFVVDVPNSRLRGNKKITYSLYKDNNGIVQGLKKEIIFYEHILKTKEPHILDTFRRITYTYDNKNYLIKETDIEMGSLGHTYQFEYKLLPENKRVLHAVVRQTVRRQGFIEQGPDIGEPEWIYFSAYHLSSSS